MIRRAATVLASGLVLAGTSRAQVQQQIPDLVACARCTITVKPLTTMRPPEDVVADRPRLVSTDNAGRYWVLFEQEPPAVYESNGRFHKTVGRKGAGPGEYVIPDHLLVVGDSVVVLDVGTARATVVDSTLAPRRYLSVPWQVLHPAAIDWPRAVIGSAIRDQRAASPDPLQVISFAGSNAVANKSFGGRVAPTAGFSAFSATHLVAQSSPGRIWAAWEYGYDISEWTTDGTLVRAYQRRPPWFLSEAPSRIGTPTRAPDSFVRGIERDASGLLWVFLRTPKTTWKDGWPAMQPGQREVMSQSFDHGKMWATTIEVIDPDAGRVVARQVIDRLIISAMPGRRVAFFSRDADELGRIDIVELTLNGR